MATAGGGPSAMASGNQTVVNGGTTAVEISADSFFNRVFVSVAGTSQGLSSSADTGLGGYYEVTLPSPQMTASVLLSFPQELRNSEFDLFFAVASDSDVAGPFTRMSFDVLQVGTGDVQVTLSWDSDSDVDLHVVDPNGDEVHWANRQVASGGELDLDSNAGCAIDGVRNENITWPVGSAPRGTYTVRVDYWSACSVAATSYTVLVNNGGNVEIFTGTFTGGGDTGGRGSGLEITTFERTSGPASTGQRTRTRQPTGPHNQALRITGRADDSSGFQRSHLGRGAPYEEVLPAFFCFEVDRAEPITVRCRSSRAQLRRGRGLASPGAPRRREPSPGHVQGSGHQVVCSC